MSDMQEIGFHSSENKKNSRESIPPDTRGFATQSSSLKFLTRLRPFDLPKAYDFAEEIIYDITAKLYSQSSNINQSQRQMREIYKLTDQLDKSKTFKNLVKIISEIWSKHQVTPQYRSFCEGRYSPPPVPPPVSAVSVIRQTNGFNCH